MVFVVATFFAPERWGGGSTVSHHLVAIVFVVARFFALENPGSGVAAVICCTLIQNI